MRPFSSAHGSEKLLATRHALLAKISKLVEGLTGLILVIIAMREIFVR
ncbi:hypothetical protein SF83666_b59530 (plasmid) [Sinorhizobium fredii CCBAU 83666]|nr:hypothetical protein SF83666_b59530 [Sinorhizobium fredii CCBAU 83666]